jgi:hypothetical protein
MCTFQVRDVPVLIFVVGVQHVDQQPSPAHLVAPPHQWKCHTRFSKEQNQDHHMCAQEVHTYAIMKKYQKQCHYIT